MTTIRFEYFKPPIKPVRSAFHWDPRGFAVCKECARLTPPKKWRIAIDACETHEQNKHIARLHYDSNHVRLN